MELQVGDKAPDFKMTTDTGEEISLKSLAGKRVVLYFYPKDNTPGCTTEACDFRDNMEALTSKGVTVIGVSPDSEKSHTNFKEKHNLNFTLAVDKEKEVSTAYGAFGEKNMYGKKTMGMIRSTFIIAPDGTLEYAKYRVRAKGHVERLMKELD
jgi:peroxiredoxin Q/BCP